jgi:hypothetical protein
LNIDEEEIEEDIILVRICGLISLIQWYYIYITLYIIYWVIYYIRETKIRDMRLRFNIPLGREINDTQRGKMIDLNYHCFATINVPPPGRSESAKRCIRNIQHCWLLQGLLRKHAVKFEWNFSLCWFCLGLFRPHPCMRWSCSRLRCLQRRGGWIQQAQTNSASANELSFLQIHGALCMTEDGLCLTVNGSSRVKRRI